MNDVVYVVIATAVYDQGVVGVYDDKNVAQSEAEKIWPQTDGHHAFRVEQLEVGKTYENVFDYVFASDWPTTEKDPLIMHWVKGDEDAPDVEFPAS